MNIHFYREKENRRWLTDQPNYRQMIIIYFAIPVILTVFMLYESITHTDLAEAEIISDRGVVEDCRYYFWHADRLEVDIDGQTFHLAGYALKRDIDDAAQLISTCIGHNVPYQYIQTDESGLLIQLKGYGIQVVDRDFALQAYLKRSAESGGNPLPVIAAIWIPFLLMLPVLNGSVRIEFSKEKSTQPPFD